MSWSGLYLLLPRSYHLHVASAEVLPGCDKEPALEPSFFTGMLPSLFQHRHAWELLVCILLVRQGPEALLGAAVLKFQNKALEDQKTLLRMGTR